MKGTAHGLLLALLAIIAVACGTAAPPTSNPTSVPTQDAQLTPTPTLNIEATVEARLQAILGGISTATPMTTPTPLPPNIFEELLGLIPDTPETRTLMIINDYAQIRQVFDIPLPGAEDDGEGLTQFWAKSWTTGAAAGPWISMYNVYSRPYVEYRNYRYLGFDPRHIDQSAQAGISPWTIEVVRGDSMTR